MEQKKCQYCLSDIPIKATKCKYCLEWQDDYLEESFSKIKENIIDINKIFYGTKQPFQLSIVRNIPLNFGASIFIICVVLFVIMQLIWYKYEDNAIYLFSIGLFSIQMMISWSGLIWIYKIIKENTTYFINISSLELEPAIKSFLNFFNKMFKAKYAISFGILVGAIASIGDYIVGTPFNSNQAKIAFAIFEFINMFFAGAAVYSMLIFAIYIRKASLNSLGTSFNSDKDDTIHNIGYIHLKSSILVIVPLLLGVLAKLVGNWDWDIMVVIWYISFAIGVIIYIYWPMYNIHLLMKQNFEIQSQMIQSKIHKLIDELKVNPSSRNFVKLDELRRLEKSINGENTWPFETKSISAAFFAIILPIVLMAIDKFWSI